MHGPTTIVTLLALTACGPRPEATEPGHDPLPADDIAHMILSSPDFENGQPIPDKHAREDENVPPALTWTNVPDTAVEMALIVEDPDAPAPEPWVHDVLYKIPVTATEMEMVLRGATVDSAARFLTGTNSWDETGWGGPKPPVGDPPHTYVFTLFALDVELDVQPGLTASELREAMEGHVVATAVLEGTYQR